MDLYEYLLDSKRTLMTVRGMRTSPARTLAVAPVVRFAVGDRVGSCDE